MTFPCVPSETAKMPRLRAKGRERAERAAESGENGGVPLPAEGAGRQEEEMEVEAADNSTATNPLHAFNIEGNNCNFVILDFII